MKAERRKQLSDATIAVNGRVARHALTGQPRYLVELLDRLPELRCIAPDRDMSGVQAHAWEQSVLPVRARGSLLWSPSTTGPLSMKRQIVTVHDTAPIDHPDWFEPRFSSWYAWLLPRLARRVLHLVAISGFTKERLVHHAGIEPDKVTVVPNGIGDTFSPRSPDEIASARAQLGLPEGRYIVTLGSVEPRKNLRVLLEAWRRVAPELEDLHLVVAGEVGATHVFKRVEISEVPARVHFTGRVPDPLLPPLLSGADVFVFPSLYEGFGLPPLEAMACGTAVLCSDRASLPEVVGDAAVLFDPGSAGPLSEELLKILRNEGQRTKLRNQGLARAGSFTWDRTAAELWPVLQGHH